VAKKLPKAVGKVKEHGDFSGSKGKRKGMKVRKKVY
jgi:hypothetical protein